MADDGGAIEANLAPGTVVGGRYVVENLLGVGGLAEVYRVRHVQLGSEHALKLLSWRRKSLAERLKVEGKIQANLRHPNVVAVTDMIEVDGQWCLLMEYVDGMTLEGMLAERGRMPVDDALALFAPVLAAVAWAHERGALHRDLKPANILLARTPVGWVPKVADFGIAKLADDVSSTGGISKTRSGVSMGTPGYMAPEQVKDSATVDNRADVFALGAILFEMIAGRQAFIEPDGSVGITSTLTVTPPRLDEADPTVTAVIADAVARAMASDRDARWLSVRDFALGLGLGGHPLFADVRDATSGVGDGGRPLPDRTWSRPSTAPTPAEASVSTTDPSGPYPTLLPPDGGTTRPEQAAAAPRSLPSTPGTPRSSSGTGARLLVAAVVFAVLVVVAAGVAGATAALGFVFLPGQTVESAPIPAPVPREPVPAPIVTPAEPAPVVAAPEVPVLAPPVGGGGGGGKAPAASVAPVAVAPVPVAAAPVAAEPEPALIAEPVVVAPAPVEPEPAVAEVEPEPVAAPPDPMVMLGTGVWKGTASGRPLELRFLGATEGVIRAEAVYVTGPTRRVDPLSGTFDPATKVLALSSADGKVTYQGRLSGGTFSGTYMQQGGKSLAWTASR